MNIKNIVLTLPIWAGCISGNGGETNGAVELFAGNKATVLDAKVNHRSESGTGIYARNIATEPYDNEDSNSFTILDLYHPINDTFDFVIEGQLPSGLDTIARFGMQGYFSKGDLGNYALLTYSPEEKNLEWINDRTYSRNFSESRALSTGLESVINFGEEGINFASAKPRVGITSGDSTYGIGANLSFGEDFRLSQTNLGFFYKLSF